MAIKNLNNSAFLFFLVIILALVFHWFTTKSYKTNKKDVLNEITNESSIMPFAELNDIINSERIKDFIFVDIRTEEEFEEGHIEGSVNVPFNDILSKKSKKVFKKDKTKVIIANKESDAHVARTTLVGNGFENILVLSGNYSMVIKHVIEKFNPAYGYYSEDKAKFDYPRYIRIGSSVSSSDAASTTKETKITVSGGC
ncbi:MAG: rhodanese-like domain-containing protein [Bacteroidetes bacterium]|nr:rhodanese-like domain-containing protein [Bacteroidota bacterium]